MKFADLVNLLLEAKRDKEPESNVQLPDGTWRRVNSDGDILYTKTENSNNYHRMDGPAVEYADGGKEWWVNDKLHRLDGPAVEYADGDKYWFVDGEQHRLDGPAVEDTDGSKMWFVNGKEYSEEEFNTIFRVSKDSAVIKQRAASNDLFR